jgi:regulator of PEP synthase PpsR (kinase-PPPase family)
VDHIFHIHLVSDSTGETLHAMTTAALAQFEDVNVRVHPYALVRSEHQLTRALDHIAIMPGIVFFTLANQSLRDKLVLRCTDIGTRAIDVLEGPVLALRQFLGQSETHKVGRQHQVDQRYLERIEVLNFTIAHDDGQSLDSINEAEVILTGASRTSKTPTCVYLAIRGIKAAMCRWCPPSAAAAPTPGGKRSADCGAVGVARPAGAGAAQPASPAWARPATAITSSRRSAGRNRRHPPIVRE